MIDQIWFNDRLAIQDIWRVLSRIDFLKVFRFVIFCPLVDLASLVAVGIIYTYILMAIDSFLPSVGHGWLVNSWLTWSIFQAFEVGNVTLETAHEHKSYICLLISLAFGTAFLFANLPSLSIGLQNMLAQLFIQSILGVLAVGLASISEPPLDWMEIFSCLIPEQPFLLSEKVTFIPLILTNLILFLQLLHFLKPLFLDHPLLLLDQFAQASSFVASAWVAIAAVISLLILSVTLNILDTTSNTVFSRNLK